MNINKKVDKYRAGYAAQGMRQAFLPAVVSTPGRIRRRCRLLAAERVFLAHAGFPWPSVRTGNYSVHSSFRQSTPSVASRAKLFSGVVERRQVASRSHVVGAVLSEV